MIPSQYRRAIQDKMDLIQDLCEELMAILSENGREMVELNTDEIFLFISKRRLWDKIKKARGKGISNCVMRASDWQRLGDGSSGGFIPGGENGVKGEG